MSTTALSYAIDDQDRLIGVDAGNHRFAENGSDGAGASLGRMPAGAEDPAVAAATDSRRGAGRRAALPLRQPEARRKTGLRIAADQSGRVVLFSARPGLRRNAACDVEKRAGGVPYPSAFQWPRSELLSTPCASP